jgi:hypothetical protein
LISLLFSLSISHHRNFLPSQISPEFVAFNRFFCLSFTASLALFFRFNNTPTLASVRR